MGGASSVSAAGPQCRHRGLSSASGSPGIGCSQDRRSLGPQRLGTRVLCTGEDALRFLDEGTHLVGTEPFPVPRTQIPRTSDRGHPARMTASPGEVQKHAVRPTPATARLAIPSLLRESTRPTRPPRPPRSAPGPARRLPERSASTSASGSRWRRRRQQVLGSGSGFLRGGDAADEVTPVGGARPGTGPRSSWGWGEPRAAPPHHAPQPLRPEPEGRSPKLSSFQTPGAPSGRRPGDGGDGAGQGTAPGHSERSCGPPGGRGAACLSWGVPRDGTGFAASGSAGFSLGTEAGGHRPPRSLRASCGR